MLSQPEFSNLARNNEAFVQLKQSLEPRFNIWTTVLAVIAVLGLLIGFVLLFGRSRFSAGKTAFGRRVFVCGDLICYVLIWTGYAIKFPYLQNTWQFLTFLWLGHLFIFI